MRFSAAMLNKIHSLGLRPALADSRRAVAAVAAMTALLAVGGTGIVLSPSSLHGTAAPPAPLAPAADTTEGVYTKAQAVEGKALYEAECSVCHGPREFMGPVFERRWFAPPVSGIFAHILNTMPQDAPGSLAPEQVARLVAYLLELNGQPAGPTPLPVELEKLAQIRVEIPVTPGSAGR